MLRKLYQTENIIFSKADAVLWIYKCLLNLAYYQAPLLKHSMADSFGGFQGSIHEENYTVFLTLPVPSQFYSITDRKINGKGLSLYYIPCTVVPSLYRTTKSSKEGRGEDGVSTRPCAQTWHARGTGDGLLPSSLSCTFFLGLFQGSCLLHLLHCSVNFHHPPQCPSRTPRSYLLEGNKLFSPHVFRENVLPTP